MNAIEIISELTSMACNLRYEGRTEAADIFDAAIEQFVADGKRITSLETALRALMTDIEADPMASSYFDLRHIDAARAALAPPASDGPDERKVNP